MLWPFWTQQTPATNPAVVPSIYRENEYRGSYLMNQVETCFYQRNRKLGWKQLSGEPENTKIPGLKSSNPASVRKYISSYRCTSVRIVLKYAIIFTGSALLWVKRYGITYYSSILEKPAVYKNRTRWSRNRVCHDYTPNYFKLLKPNDVKRNKQTLKRGF